MRRLGIPTAKVASAALVALCLAATAPRAAVVEEIVAWVNGQIITRSELMERENALVSQLSSRLVGDDLERELTRMRGTILSDMIRELILLQRAEILGLELDKVYEQALNQLKEQQGIKSNQELDNLLRQEGIDREELRKTLLRFNVPDIMVNLEVREKISVTDEEVEEYFQQNRESLRVKEEFTISEIVLLKEQHSDDELQELGASAEQDLAGGMPFNEAVVKYSEAPSRFKDGLLGTFGRGDLAPDIEAAALKLSPGEVSPPVQTPAGVHIIRLDSYTTPQDPDLEASRGEIVKRLKTQKFAKALDEYFKMLLETNRIEVNPNYKQYDARS